MTENLPEKPYKADKKGFDKENINALFINELNYKSSDFKEFRLLAEANPEIAKEVLKLKDQTDRRDNNSMRLGMVLAFMLAGGLLCAASFILINLGWWQSISAIGVLLACGHFLRVALKGEWSDTNWFTQFFAVKSEPRGPTQQPDSEL